MKMFFRAYNLVKNKITRSFIMFIQTPEIRSASHNRVWLDDFEIIGKGFKSSFKRQISEALHIKEKAPDLNIQKDAYRLSLYS